MATAKKDDQQEQATDQTGVDPEKLRQQKGEMVGKVRGQDIDSSHHVYEFTDPKTGEPLETHQVVHDVATGVNSDGTLQTGKMTDQFAKPAGGADTKQSEGANQGEAGEVNPATGRAPK